LKGPQKAKGNEKKGPLNVCKIIVDESDKVPKKLCKMKHPQ